MQHKQTIAKEDTAKTEKTNEKNYKERKKRISNNFQEYYRKKKNIHKIKTPANLYSYTLNFDSIQLTLKQFSTVRKKFA